MSRLLLTTSIGLSLFLVGLSGLAAPKPQTDPTQPTNLSRLSVSSNGRYLVEQRDEGLKPFFWMADTAWELLHRLEREEIEYYLSVRKTQQFNVIQTVLIGEMDGLNSANARGHRPLQNNDPKKPDVHPGADDDYWDDVDWFLRRAADQGFYVALLPTWGEWVTPRRVKEPVFQTAEQGYQYGRFLGERFRNHNHIVWILGGDRRPVEMPHGIEVWESMAEGIADGTNGNGKQDGKADWTTTLMSYHSMPSSSKWFSEAPWIDFHLWGTYHSTKDWPRSFQVALEDYQNRPIKPTLNGEPCYEEIPRDYKGDNGYFNAFEVRRAAWWSVLSGTMGHTYGAHPVWYMYTGTPYTDAKMPLPSISPTRMTWKEALKLPGGNQMRYLRTFFEALDFSTYEPNLEQVDTQETVTEDYVASGTGSNYIVAYTPTGKLIRLDTSLFRDRLLSARWYNPRQGTYGKAEEFVGGQERDFYPPTAKKPVASKTNCDWVLVISVVERSRFRRDLLRND